MNTVFLGIGSNIYPRLHYLYQALNLIEKHIGKIEKHSSVYKTDPWGMPADTPFFYNMCALVHSPLNAWNVLGAIQNIEQLMGRVKKNNDRQIYESRIIDVDILFFNDEVIQNKDLIVPHPLLHKREFVLLPLSELASDVEHPVLKKTIKELLLCQNMYA